PELAYTTGLVGSAVAFAARCPAGGRRISAFRRRLAPAIRGRANIRGVGDDARAAAALGNRPAAAVRLVAGGRLFLGLVHVGALDPRRLLPARQNLRLLRP